VTPALDAGGVETLTLDMAAATAGAGARSLVASRGGRLEGALAQAGGELIRLPVHSRNPLTLAANAHRLETVIRRENVSLVHVRSRAPAFSALAAARRAGVPLVATYHGIYSAASPIKRWYNAVMTRGDAVIANSAFTQAHIAAEHGLPPESITVIPEGVDAEAFNPAAVSSARIGALRARWDIGPDERRRIILLPARLTGWKGHRIFIEALARSPARGQVLAVLAGSGEATALAGEIRAAIGSANLEESVRMVGPCADMPAAYTLADLVVAPSTLPESFGRSVVEAAAMATPVIASRLGAHAETVVDGLTGWLVAPGDAGALAEAIDAALAADPAALAAMGAAARERARRLYSLPAMCEATFDLYRRVLESRR
jgi:glycosyltransferase involved in cell wall biosynthesis